MQSPTCATCPFFRALDIDHHGTCHVEPPKDSPGGFGYWPKVQSREFCSEHPQAQGSKTQYLLALIAHHLDMANQGMRVTPDRAL